MSRAKSTIGVLVRGAISAALIGYLLSRVDLTDIGDRLGAMAPATTAVALAILVAQVPVVTLRWTRVIGAIAMPIRFATALRLVLIGLFFNQTLPSAIGGDVVRIWRAHKLGLPLGKATNSVLLDRISALGATAVLVAASLPWVWARFDVAAIRYALVALVATTATGFALLLSLDLIPGPPTRWRLTRGIHALAVDARRVLGSASTGVPTLALSALVVVSTGVVVHFLASALDVRVDLLDALVLTPLVLLATMVPVSLAGWGVREVSMVTALGTVGVPAADALAVSLTFGLCVVLVGLPGGLVWLQHHQPGELAIIRREHDARPDLP